MTRMQKYQSYRDEIARSSKLGYSIALDNQNIMKYKKEIDKVNSSILTSMSDQKISLHKGVSEVAISQKQVPVEISKLFSTLNKAKNTINRENVSTIFFNITNSSIVDKKNKIKEEWLKHNSDYAELISFSSNLNFNQKEVLEKNLQSKYDNFKVDEKQKEIIAINELHKDDKKQISHYVFVVSATVAVIFLIITFALLITWMVL